MRDLVDDLTCRPTARWAYEITRATLAEPLPSRYRHCLGVAAQAVTLAPILGDDAELLETAGVLHDIGYSPQLVSTGFHAIDGARYLRDVVGADRRIVNLVAHHSCAAMEADIRGIGELMTEFDLEIPLLTDALIYCDMTTTPAGELTTIDDRLSEIICRYGPDGIVGQFIAAAESRLRASTSRSVERLRTVSV